MALPPNSAEFAVYRCCAGQGYMGFGPPDGGLTTITGTRNLLDLSVLPRSGLSYRQRRLKQALASVVLGKYGW